MEDEGRIIEEQLRQMGMGELVRARGSSENYPHLVVNVDDASYHWAHGRCDWLKQDPGPLEGLAKWAREAAQQANAAPPYALVRYPRWDYFQGLLTEYDILGPEALEPNSMPIIEEDLNAVLDYCEVMALRRRQNRFGYDLAALVVYCGGVNGGCSAFRPTAPKPDDAQLRLIADVANQRSAVAAGIRLRAIGVTDKLGPRYWFQDELEGIDLFRPLEEDGEEAASR
jgi:hypothetical protein